MKNTMKKIFSLVLTVGMLICSAPMTNAAETTYQVGDIVQFGSYPQSKVTDPTLLAQLNALVPVWDEWISYGYYSGDGNRDSMVQGDWMKYIDIVYNSDKYRAVKFIEYRPNDTTSGEYWGSYQGKNGYYVDTIYWFKFEPINWIILDPTTGLVVCENILDSQPFTNTIYIKYNGATSISYNDSMHTNYANDYETSSIRKWLNNDFYNEAFTINEKEEINYSVLIKDVSIYYDDYTTCDENAIVDEIFILSYSEVVNEAFGFKSDSVDKDPLKLVRGTDYAQCQGLDVFLQSNSTYYGYAIWGLRSTYCLNNADYQNARGLRDSVSFVGNFCCSMANLSSTGVRPALRFKDISKITKIVNMCDCNCHAGGIKAFFFKIINFFQKLFSINKVCACGVKH